MKTVFVIQHGNEIELVSRNLKIICDYLLKLYAIHDSRPRESYWTIRRTLLKHPHISLTDYKVGFHKITRTELIGRKRPDLRKIKETAL